MPRRARVRSPRGAGVRPRRAALSTPASPRSNAVVVDGAPARRYCVIRRARPRATSQRATRAGLGDGPNLVLSSICRLWTLHNRSKKSFFCFDFFQTAVHCRIVRLGDAPFKPPVFKLRAKNFSDQTKESQRRATSPPTPLRSAIASDSHPARPQSSSPRARTVRSPALLFVEGKAQSSRVSVSEISAGTADRADRSFCFPAPKARTPIVTRRALPVRLVQV